MVYFNSTPEIGYKTYVLSDSNYVYLQNHFVNRNCSSLLLNSASFFKGIKIALVRTLTLKKSINESDQQSLIK